MEEERLAAAVVVVMVVAAAAAAVEEEEEEPQSLKFPSHLVWTRASFHGHARDASWESSASFVAV